MSALPDLLAGLTARARAQVAGWLWLVVGPKDDDAHADVTVLPLALACPAEPHDEKLAPRILSALRRAGWILQHGTIATRGALCREARAWANAERTRARRRRTRSRGGGEEPAAHLSGGGL